MAEQNSSLKWLWVALSIIGLLIFGPISFFSLFYMFSGYGGGMWRLLGFMPIAVVVMIILGLVRIFSKKKERSDKKNYKAQDAPRVMKIQYLFYIVGVIFVFASVWYFAKEYIAQFPNSVKLILLVVSVVVSYVIAEFMRGSDV
ncbi:MAG: hypothetical protein AABX96_04415 [Nanoarchaeota archaeon]